MLWSRRGRQTLAAACSVYIGAQGLDSWFFTPLTDYPAKFEVTGVMEWDTFGLPTRSLIQFTTLLGSSLGLPASSTRCHILFIITFSHTFESPLVRGKHRPPASILTRVFDCIQHLIGS